MFKRLLLWLGFLGILPLTFAQIENPVSWSFSTTPAADGNVTVNFVASIEQGWHLYSQFIEEGGPVPTTFTFEDVTGYELVGKVAENGSIHSGFDETFKMDLAYFDTKVTFSQVVNLNGASATVGGYLEFMVCNDEKCLPPTYVDFSIPVVATAAVEEVEPEPIPAPVPAVTETPDQPEVRIAETEQAEPVEEGDASPALIPGMPAGIVENPVTWSYDRREGKDGMHELVFTATIDEGWKIYGQHIEPGGPVPTEFYIEEGEGYELIGMPAEVGEIHEGFDDVFKMDVNYYFDKVDFVQQVKFSGEPVPVKGELVFMTCEEGRCLNPKYVEFNIGGKQPTLGSGEGAASNLILDNLDLANPHSECVEATETGISIWGDFFKGFLGGLIALLTPCVFPMIPLTVSFFTKSSTDRKKGLANAFLYGLAIFAIYAIASAPFHLIEGIAGNVFNEISTNPWLNIGFFAIFVAFAISFFGYYEITLPSGIANRANSSSGVTNLVGIFFMALTLCIVSFSCTGPILGSLVAVSASGSVSAWNLTGAMGGFGLALALPFGLFAAFPGWLNSLPKSGGWLTTVKVVLGFIELGLAIKFFSNADLVMDWGILLRETFFLLWIVIGVLMVLYLLGFIRFPHDAPLSLKKVSVGSWITIAIVGSFTLYLVPGLFKGEMANRSLVSGFPPPMFYSWYEQDNHCPLDLPCFHDFDEGLAIAKETGKPIMIDFTGKACVNCRKMEENVWNKPDVFKRISEDYVLISLYVDDRTPLSEEEIGRVVTMSTGSTRKLRTVGDKWAVFQEENFQHNTQPLYALITTDGELLNNPVAYTPDKEEYLDFLDCGLSAFAEKQAMAAKE